MTKHLPLYRLECQKQATVSGSVSVVPTVNYSNYFDKGLYLINMYVPYYIYWHVGYGG